MTTTPHWLSGSANLDDTAAALRLVADPTRLQILALLQPGEKNVTALCDRLGLAQPTVSHHLGLMRTARLLVTRRAGKQIFYALNGDVVDAPRVATDAEGQVVAAPLVVRLGGVEVRLGTEEPAQRDRGDEPRSVHIETKPMRPVKPVLALSGTG